MCQPNHPSPLLHLFKHAGSFCPQGAAKDTVCTGGSYCLGYGLAAVSGQCRAGFYCPPGSSQPTDSMCAAGSYCPAGSSVANGAGTCLAGYYCPIGSAVATEKPCPPSFYCLAGASLDTGSGRCQIGFYCPGLSVDEKGNGTWYATVFGFARSAFFVCLSYFDADSSRSYLSLLSALACRPVGLVSCSSLDLMLGTCLSVCHLPTSL